MGGLEGSLFEVKKEADMVDHYRALEGKLRRELDRLTSDNGELKEEISNFLSKKEIEFGQ